MHWSCKLMMLRQPERSLTMQLAKRISPSMDIGPLSAPYLLVPMLALAQLVNVALPGQEPDPAQPFCEDMRLFDSAFAEPDGAAQLHLATLCTCRCIAESFFCVHAQARPGRQPSAGSTSGTSGTGRGTALAPSMSGPSACISTLST